LQTTAVSVASNAHGTGVGGSGGSSSSSISHGSPWQPQLHPSSTQWVSAAPPRQPARARRAPTPTPVARRHSGDKLDTWYMPAFHYRPLLSAYNTTRNRVCL
jgi:hypothetical protein